MLGLQRFEKQICQKNVNEHLVACSYDHWYRTFPQGHSVRGHIDILREVLGENYGRADLVDLYADANIESSTKFVGTMIWGHEAPAGSRRDTRGPWKVAQMFENFDDTQSILRRVSAELSLLEASYRELSRIPRCGPNFFTKHLYFLGKSSGARLYPLIFDDRVATGILKVGMSNNDAFGLVSVHAGRKFKHYRSYLDQAIQSANELQCDLDKIEYFLFLQ